MNKQRKGIYVVSKIKQAERWKTLRALRSPIISTWIDDGLEHEVNFAEAWPRYIQEASSAAAMVVYLEDGDKLKGGLLEIGAGLAGGAQVFVVGNAPQLRTAIWHPSFRVIGSLWGALVEAEKVCAQAHAVLTREETVAQWIVSRFGEEILRDKKERARRVAEESIELAQTVDVPIEQLHAIVDHVYSRPPGEVSQEVAGVGVTLLGFTASQGISFDDVVDAEIERINSLPIDYFRKRQEAKARVGIAALPVGSNMTCN